MFIKVSNLTKTFRVLQKEMGIKGALKAFIKPNYKYVEAVKNISFEIEKGEIIGYIGPNGAGKSTTIKMLAGILKPDGGQVIVNNLNPFSDRKKYVSHIGVVFGQKSQLWWDIPVIESFELLRKIYKVNKEQYEETKEELVKLLNIRDILNIPVRQLSLGQRMRCEIVASLLHNPEVLFLDEPTIGLDAVSKVQLRKFIKEINIKRKVTIILTTHDMADIEALAKRVIVIGKGEKLFDGELKSLKNKFKTHKQLEIIFKNKTKDVELKSEIVEENDNKVIINVNDRKESISYIISKYSEQCDILDVNIYEDNIDDIILKMYEEYNI